MNISQQAVKWPRADAWGSDRELVGGEQCMKKRSRRADDC
jgi:hypothetical protein